MKCYIRKLDIPPYRMHPFEGAEKLGRFDESLHAFNNEELAEQKFGGVSWRLATEKIVIKKIQDGIPGYTLLDQAIADVAKTSVEYRNANFYSWEPLGVAKLDRIEKVGRWEASPEDNSSYIKKAAAVFGAGDCGIAPLNEQWFYNRGVENRLVRVGDLKSKPIQFSSEHDKPIITNKAFIIPKSMKRIIVILVPMDGFLTRYSPSSLAASDTRMSYSVMGEIASKMAEFIRGLGYNAIPMGNNTALNIPMAIDAGLGELGRHGLLIHPKMGSLLRICKVLTDMPLLPDKPIKFGAAEFCMTCKKCAKKCPSNSISFDREPSPHVTSVSNNKGMKKWYVNAWSCLEFWMKNGTSCTNCITVCAFSKRPGWTHDATRVVISVKSSPFNKAVIAMDDLFGYGSTLTDNDPLKWWNSDMRPRKWGH